MALMADTIPDCQVFVSYARADKSWWHMLLKQLIPLQKLGLITAWQDNQALIGQTSDPVETRLQKAHLILLLISPDFLASEECSTQMHLALKRQRDGLCRVVPILLRSVHWQTDGELTKLKPLPTGEKPVVLWSSADAAFVDIARSLRATLYEMAQAQTPDLPAASATTARPHAFAPLNIPTTGEHIEQRASVVNAFHTQLISSCTNGLFITGISGIGKTTLAALLFQYAESLRLANEGPWQARATWLRLDATTTSTDLFLTIYKAFAKPAPDMAQLEPDEQARRCFALLQSTAQPRLLVIDQFEHVLTGARPFSISGYTAAQPGIATWLHLLSSQPCQSRVVLTCPRLPTGNYASPSSRLRFFTLPGLDAQESLSLLQNLGIQGEALSQVTTLAGGHPLTFTLLAAQGRSHTRRLPSLLAQADQTQSEQEDAPRQVFEVIFSQLAQAPRELLQAFSLYREAVPFEAAQHVLPALSADDSSSPARLKEALNLLVDQSLLQQCDAHYELHPLVARYAYARLSPGAQEDSPASRTAHLQAADYYLKQADSYNTPAPSSELADKSHLQVEAIWHLCRAAQWQRAYTLCQELNLPRHLRLQGAAVTLLNLFCEFFPLERWQPTARQEGQIFNELGEIYTRLGRRQEAYTAFEKALATFRAHDLQEELPCVLNALGAAHYALWQKDQGHRCYKEALLRARESQNSTEEGAALHNLGRVTADLRNMRLALNYFEQALAVYRSQENYKAEAQVLNNIGEVYAKTGRREIALEYFQQALHLFLEIGEPRGQAMVLNNVGIHYRKLRMHQEAHECYVQSCYLFQELGDRRGEGTALRNLGRLILPLGRPQEALACFLAAHACFTPTDSPEQGEIPLWIRVLMRQYMNQETYNTALSEVAPVAHHHVAQVLAEEVF